MRKLLLLAACTVLLFGCSAPTGGPSEAEIRDTLEQKYRTDLQEMIDWMVSMRGEQGRQAVLSAAGVAAPADIVIADLRTENVRGLSNGDFLAEVVYVKRNGTTEQQKTARITLTEVKGHWKVIGMEIL